MRPLVLLGFILLPFLHAFSQSTVFQVWNELGASAKLSKDWSCGVDLTTRFGNGGVVTYFPQVSIKYKWNKFIRPSLDYRMIMNRELNGNYLASHRINGNLQFSYALNRHSFGFRVRYQYSFNRIIGTYEPEFDQAFRFKPSYSLDINNSIFSPKASCEFFYNPASGAQGKQFTRIRYYAGLALEIQGPHGIEIGWLYDQRINKANPVNRSVMLISYSYALGTQKKDKPKTKGVRDL
ncbi:MAG: DUF2490 domain-containing protein [Crocinitomicaceae bacterium]